MTPIQSFVRLSFVAATVCVLSATCNAQASAPPASGSPVAAVKPGIWQTTTVIENPNNASRREIVGQTCVVAADASNLARMVPSQREPGMQCENRDVKREGASVVWAISCKSADTVYAGKGRMSLYAENYLGTADVDVRKQGGKPAKLSQSFSGKWLKPCS